VVTEVTLLLILTVVVVVAAVVDAVGGVVAVDVRSSSSLSFSSLVPM